MDRKLWEPLQRFESRDYLTRHYKKLHNRSLNMQRANEIGSCFTQGREYFFSASTASETVKPLLIYYGIASLSRGATLLKDISKREESLTPAHGLMTIDWAKILHTGISEVLNLRIQSSKGLFQEFVSAVGNGQSYSWLNKDGRIGSFKKEFGELAFFKDDSQLSLGDLLSRERELFCEYEIANDGWGNVDVGVVVALEASLRIHFSITQQGSAEDMINLYQFPTSSKISIEPHPQYSHVPQLKTLCIEIPATGEDLKRYAPLAIEQGTNLGWIIRPFSNGDNIIDIHRMFMESFILGMFSRYFPSRWMSLLRSEKGDIARSVVLAAIARIEDRFPRLLHDQLPS